MLAGTAQWATTVWNQAIWQLGFTAAGLASLISGASANPLQQTPQPPQPPGAPVPPHAPPAQHPATHWPHWGPTRVHNPAAPMPRANPEAAPGAAPGPAAAAAAAAPQAAHPPAENLPRVVSNPLYKAAAQQPMVVPQQLDIGSRDQACSACRAKLWPAEVKADGTGGMLCCNHGKACSISSLWPQATPQPLLRLLSANPAQDAEARTFQQNLRKYNCLLQMASSGIKLSNPPTGVSMLAVRGGVYHMLPSLQPNASEPAKFAQLYIIDDEDEQIAKRLAALNLHAGPAGPAQPAAADNTVNTVTLRSLQDMMVANNQYVRHYKQVFQLNASGLPQYDLVILTDGTPDKRRYNAPTNGEVGGLMPGEKELSSAGSSVGDVASNISP